MAGHPLEMRRWSKRTLRSAMVVKWSPNVAPTWVTIFQMPPEIAIASTCCALLANPGRDPLANPDRTGTENQGCFNQRKKVMARCPHEVMATVLLTGSVSKPTIAKSFRHLSHLRIELNIGYRFYGRFRGFRGTPPKLQYSTTIEFFFDDNGNNIERPQPWFPVFVPLRNSPSDRVIARWLAGPSQAAEILWPCCRLARSGGGRWRPSSQGSILKVILIQYVYKG